MMKAKLLLILCLLVSIWSNAQWQLNGNAGTNPATNFLGTTDNVPLFLRVNNIPAGKLDQGQQCVFLGVNTPVSSTGVNNTVMGDSAAFAMSTGIRNTVIGAGAGKVFTTSSDNVYIGNDAGKNSAQGDNTIIGASAGTNNSGESVTIIGKEAGRANTGNGVVLLGEIAGENNTQGNIIAIGFGAGRFNSGATSVLIGNSAGSTNAGADNVFVGSQSGANNTSGSVNTFIGDESGFSNTTASFNTFVGHRAGKNNSTGDENTFTGALSGQNNSSGSNNVFNGMFTGFHNSTGSDNTFVGYSSGEFNTSGSSNVYIGANAGIFSNSNENTFVGVNSGNQNSNGQSNTFVGNLAAKANSSGSFNTVLGDSAAFTNTTGSLNTILGYRANVGTNNLVNATAIGANAVVNSSNSVVIGNGANVGIGVSSPLDKLHIAGSIRMVDGNQGAAKVMTSDANGTASWQPVPSTTPIGAATGDLGGTYPSPTVDGLQGVAVSATLPIAGQVLTFNGTQWIATVPASVSPSGSAGGDLGGTYPSPIVDGLQGVAVSANAPTNGQVLSFNGTAWTPTNLPAASVDWSLNGNSGTNGSTNFVGTIDNVPLHFRVNNTRAGRIESLSSKNIMFGINAGNNAISGIDNTLYGANSGSALTLGQGNAAFGSGAGTLTTTGSNNCFFGSSTGAANVSGINNCFFGAAAGLASIGNSNTFIGKSAGAANTTGSNNCALGLNAGDTNDANTNCTFIGFDADQTVTTDFTNSTSLGNATRITASNQVRIGSSTVTSIGGFVNWTNVSDARFKTDVKENVVGMEFINKLRPVTYHLDVNAINDFVKVENQDQTSLQLKNNEIQSGFIAQEVLRAAKESDYDFSGVDKPKNDDDFYGLRYAEFVVPMVKGMQELDAENRMLKSTLSELSSRIETLENILNGDATNNINAEIQAMTIPAEAKMVHIGNCMPNPNHGKMSIPYYLPEAIEAAYLMITASNGIVIFKESINGRGEGILELDATALAAGTYYYTLWVDDVKIDTHTFMLTSGQ